MILGVVGYFVYKNYLVKSQTTEEETSLSVTGTITGQKTTIDVGAAIGTVMVPSGWQTSFANDKNNPTIVGKVIKTVDIKNGEYSIQISTFENGRAPCGSRNTLLPNYVYFKDQSGYEYFRQKTSNTTFPNSLNVCSNGVTGKGSDSFGQNEAAFGQIVYGIPNNPDVKVLNQMDNIVASFKTD